MSKNIVRNTSKAGSGSYGYNYASLADIADQGFDIPEMRIKNVFTPDGSTYIGDWIEYKDKDGNWQLGSRIVEAELKGMNPMQSRGSSETYARRYTTLMALQLAGQDDTKIEDEGVQRKTTSQTNQTRKEFKSDPRLNFDTIRETCATIDDKDSLKAYYDELMELKPSQGALPYINKIINERKAQL